MHLLQKHFYSLYIDDNVYDSLFFSFLISIPTYQQKQNLEQ